MKTRIIPQLADNASDVLKAALNYPCAGYQLTFSVVSEGEWQLNRLTNKFEKTGRAGGIPIIEREESGAFDAWLIGQIARGFVTISCGDRYYFKELHRATGRQMPIDPPAVKTIPIEDNYAHLVEAINAGDLPEAKRLAQQIGA